MNAVADILSHLLCTCFIFESTESIMMALCEGLNQQLSETLKIGLYLLNITVTSRPVPWNSPEKLLVYTAGHDIIRVLRDPDVHYCVDNIPPNVSILSQMNPVCILSTCFSKNYCCINFSYMPMS
jgi:hypothetical protein